MPERTPARRKPSLATHICVGVFVRSYPFAILSQEARVVVFRVSMAASLQMRSP